MKGDSLKHLAPHLFKLCSVVAIAAWAGAAGGCGGMASEASEPVQVDAAPADPAAVEEAIKAAIVRQELNRNCFGTAPPTTAPAPRCAECGTAPTNEAAAGRPAGEGGEHFDGGRADGRRD